MVTPPAELTVIIPIYNERDTLPTLLERVRSAPERLQIILVDDASTDGTRELLIETAALHRENEVVLFHDKNQGKGACIRTAIPFAAGTYSIIQDADLEYQPEDFPIILDAFRLDHEDVVYGSRFLKGRPHMKPANRMVNLLLAWMVRFLFGAPITDEATCYKAFRTDVLQGLQLNCRRFEFCPEVTARLIRSGYTIREVPINYVARTIEQGKKIRWTDGIEAIWTLIKYRFKRLNDPTAEEVRRRRSE